MNARERLTELGALRSARGLTAGEWEEVARCFTELGDRAQAVRALREAEAVRAAMAGPTGVPVLDQVLAGAAAPPDRRQRDPRVVPAVMAAVVVLALVMSMTGSREDGPPRERVSYLDAKLWTAAMTVNLNQLGYTGVNLAPAHYDEQVYGLIAHSPALLSAEEAEAFAWVLGEKFCEQFLRHGYMLRVEVYTGASQKPIAKISYRPPAL